MARETITISSVASLAGATDGHNRFGFQWTHNSIWVWQSTSNRATKPQWYQPAAQPIESVGYYSRASSRRRVQPPIAGAIYPVYNFDAPIECEYHWKLRDNAHNNGWCHIVFQEWAQTSLLGYFFQRNLWLQWAETCIYRFKPVLHTAASTTKEETEQRDVFSQRRGRSQYTCEICG